MLLNRTVLKAGLLAAQWTALQAKTMMELLKKQPHDQIGAAGHPGTSSQAIRRRIVRAGWPQLHHALSVYEIDVSKFEIIRSYEVDHNPNSIALKDNRYLFVSARGPNDPVSYLLRSPRNGYLSIIDIEKKELFCKIEGGNQPTGLAISNNGKYLANTNFRDDTFEIYYIGDLK